MRAPCLPTFDSAAAAAITRTHAGHVAAHADTSPGHGGGSCRLCRKRLLPGRTCTRNVAAAVLLQDRAEVICVACCVA
eukprot:355136-Chlamydomonas_euryale.AAC.15